MSMTLLLRTLGIAAVILAALWMCQRFPGYVPGTIILLAISLGIAVSTHDE